jgi:hypothetical protein
VSLREEGEEINLAGRIIWGNGEKMKKKCSKIDGGNVELFVKSTCVELLWKVPAKRDHSFNYVR